MWVFWEFIVYLRCKLKHPEWFDIKFSEYKGYRKARGYRWEKWLVSMRLDRTEVFTVWWQFAHENHEPLILSVCPQPLEIEDYRENDYF